MLGRAAAETSAAIAEHTSLVGFVPNPGGLPLYLDDRSNIRGTRMLTKVRLGHLMVLATVGRMLHWPHSRARCVLCDDGIETVQHFVNDCRFLAPCRARMMREICSALPLAGDAGLRRLSELRSSHDPWLKCVFPVAAEDVNEMEGLAAWIVDKAIKNCLDVMWRIRESIVGRLNVTAGKLVVLPGRGEKTTDLMARQESTRAMTAEVVLRYRHHWSQVHDAEG